MEFDPDYQTSTVADLTPQTRGAAQGEWLREDLLPQQKYGPFYRVSVGDWEPSRETSKGRWAGMEKPSTKKEANEMYALDHLELRHPWKLYTFRIFPTRLVWQFKSKVKGGKSEQIKLPNPVCEFIEIDGVEKLE